MEEDSFRTNFRMINSTALQVIYFSVFGLDGFDLGFYGSGFLMAHVIGYSR